MNSKKIWKRIKKLPNVVGFDTELQPKIRRNKEYKDIPSIRIFVVKKVPLEEFKFKVGIKERILRFFTGKPLTKKDLIPFEIDGIPTDVVEIGEVRAVQDPKKKYRPIKIGISSTHYKSTACTLTGFFKQGDKVLVASNCHCFGLENKAKKGDPVLQPSPYDGGTLKDTIGKVHHFVEIKFNGFKCPYRNFFHSFFRLVSREKWNRVDIAFATLEVDWKNEVLKIGKPKGKREAKVGDLVQKMGRTTGYTSYGKVVSTNWTGRVTYSRGVAVFTDCILIEKKGFSKGGDSGSLILDMDGNVLGVLFAGSETHTIACKIKNVEEEGNVQIILEES